MEGVDDAGSRLVFGGRASLGLRKPPRPFARRCCCGRRAPRPGRGLGDHRLAGAPRPSDWTICCAIHAVIFPIGGRAAFERLDDLLRHPRDHLSDLRRGERLEPEFPPVGPLPGGDDFCQRVGFARLAASLRIGQST